MDIYNMINVLRIIQRLVARNQNIDHGSNGYREFHAVIESLIAALEALVPPIMPLLVEPMPITPGENAAKP